MELCARQHPGLRQKQQKLERVKVHSFSRMVQHFQMPIIFIVFTVMDLLAIQAPVIDGFCQVVGCHACSTVQVCNGARDFENPVIGARRELQSVHCLLQ